jgi:hypothetical protein
MNLVESRDAAFLNKVVNDPSVHPSVSLGYGEIDVSPLFERPTTVFLACEFGGFLFIDCGNGLYEVHTQFLPEGRGPAVLRLAREAAVHMFTRTPCIAISTFVAQTNEAAKRLTLAMGFKELGPKSINGVDGTGYLLTIKDWVCH